MKLATLRNGRPDGQLVVVSRDLARAVDASAIAPDLRHALDHWGDVQPALQALADQLAAGAAPQAFAFDATQCAAPLPRTWAWCDGSAFLNHGHLMARAFNTPPIPLFDTVPVMYQGAADDFLGPTDDVPLPDEAHGIDFEGEFGVIVDSVPLGATPEEALARIRLVVQLNDWSLRGLGAHEVKTGFGFLHAKPSTSFAPVAVTPDELGTAWRDGRVQMNLHIDWNGAWFGQPHGGEMNFHFGELVAHAARTRKLSAGTLIGSGTVSNRARSAGSACIAERRIIETLDHGAATTGFMRFGDRVRMEARAEGAKTGPFGVIDQRVVQAVTV